MMPDAVTRPARRLGSRRRRLFLPCRRGTDCFWPRGAPSAVCVLRLRPAVGRRRLTTERGPASGADLRKAEGRDGFFGCAHAGPIECRLEFCLSQYVHYTYTWGGAPGNRGPGAATPLAPQGWAWFLLANNKGEGDDDDTTAIPLRFSFFLASNLVAQHHIRRHHHE